MRFISLLFLIIFIVVGGGFAWQNQEAISVRFFDWSVSTSLALLVAAAYVLGMVSGWAVVGMLRRSVERVTEYHHATR